MSEAIATTLGAPPSTNPAPQSSSPTSREPSAVDRGIGSEEAGRPAEADIAGSDEPANGWHIPTLADDASEAEVTAYREAMGVPADPTGYEIDAPEDYLASDVELEILPAYAEAMHEAHVPAKAAKAALDFFRKAQMANEAAIVELDLERQDDWQMETRANLGDDYERVTADASRFLDQHFDPDEKAEFLNARFPSGGRLGDHPRFVELIATLVRSSRDQHSRVGEGTANSSAQPGARAPHSDAERQAQLEGLWSTNRKQYDSPVVQRELNSIIERRIARGELDSNGNPVRRRRAREE